MVELFKTIFKLYNLKIISIFVCVFFIVQIPQFQKTPDLFQLIKIEPPQAYLFRMLSINMGFSSFILTTFLLIYNVFSKRLRRTSFDFILSNHWIILTFSIFGGSIIFILLSIFVIQFSTLNTTITLLYLSTIITFGNLFLQFPMLILSIRYSNSFNSIKKIIKNVNKTDIDILYNPSNIRGEDYSIEDLEKNKIVQLKDIGVSAIKENDWGLPQTILNDLFEKLIDKSNLDYSDTKVLRKPLYAYNFVSRHIQKVAISETDEITIKSALGNLFRIHYFFIKHNIRNIRHNSVDANLQDLLRDIADDSSYYNIQQYLLRNTVELIGSHIKSVNYSDEELPTSDYIFSFKNFDYESRDETLSDYWFYLKFELPEIFFNILKYAIETDNKSIYSHFNWKLQSLIENITDGSNLTKSQENELFTEYSYKVRRISDLAMEHKIFRDIEFFSHLQIKRWIREEKKYAFSAFYAFASLIKKLNKLNGLDSMLIDDYFMIARSLSSEIINKETKLRVFDTIIEDGFEIYHLDATQSHVKDEVKKQLIWLKQFIDREKDLTEIKKEFYEKLKVF